MKMDSLTVQRLAEDSLPYVLPVHARIVKAAISSVELCLLFKQKHTCCRMNLLDVELARLCVSGFTGLTKGFRAKLAPSTEFGLYQ